MAIFDPSPGIVRAIIYIETADGKKTAYDFGDVGEMTIETDWEPYWSPGSLNSRSSRRCDLTFEFRDVGGYTVFTPEYFTPPEPRQDPSTAIALGPRRVEK